MDFNSTIDLIIQDLKAASEIIDDLKKYPGVPALQVELAKSKCRSAGEVIGMLKNQSNIFSEKEEPVKEKPIQDKPPVEIKRPVEKPGEPEIIKPPVSPI